MGEDTVCRVEESHRPNKPAIEVIHDVFNPIEKIEKIIGEKIDNQQAKITEIHSMISRITESILPICRTTNSHK
jgi:hypothetical protein